MENYNCPSRFEVGVERENDKNIICDGMKNIKRVKENNGM